MVANIVQLCYNIKSQPEIERAVFGSAMICKWQYLESSSILISQAYDKA